MWNEREERKPRVVSVKRGQEDVFTVKLLKRRICSTAKGQRQFFFAYSMSAWGEVID